MAQDTKVRKEGWQSWRGREGRGKQMSPCCLFLYNNKNNNNNNFIYTTPLKTELTKCFDRQNKGRIPSEAKKQQQKASEATTKHKQGIIKIKLRQNTMKDKKAGKRQ